MGYMNLFPLFEELLLELQVLINSDKKYDLIKSSRVLRQLLLDGDALLHIVNRELRAQPRFIVRSIAEKNTDFFEPDIYPQNDDLDVLKLPLKSFLSLTVGRRGVASITVREIIKYTAIVLGGVHFKENPRGEYAHVADVHCGYGDNEVSPVLVALKMIGMVTRDALIPIRDGLLARERFEAGSGWTALLCLRLLPVPPDEENYILDIGSRENIDRFSIYVDTRGELTFRVIDGEGNRKYLRAGKVGRAVPMNLPIMILCELSTIEGQSLLSIRTDGWDHAEIVDGIALKKIGDPFHFVTGSDCTGRKCTHMDQFGTLLIARTLTALEVDQAVSHFAEKVRTSEGFVRFSGNQFLYSTSHPNFKNDN